MKEIDCCDRYCILGAGSSGLAALKTFRERGLPAVALEREADLGGNWNYGSRASAVYESTHLISSKRQTEYTDFPMPKAFPPFPHQRQVQEYLRAYAEHFRLREAIEFGAEVVRAAPQDGRWRVELANGEARLYRGLIVANGHNWDPNWPQFPGEFHGLSLHSSQYKTPEPLRGKRVLVVGAGNSGCDLAVESALHAARTLHSLRRGYYFVPKFILGRPSDSAWEGLLRWRLPLWLRRLVARVALRIAVGPPERYGLPRPDHRLFETHPIVNSQLPYFVGHGRIVPKPDVERLCGSEVRFRDGSQEPVDVIVYATGFKISFPFLDQALLNWRDGRPDLYLNVFHPQFEQLFVLGLIQPDSGQFGLVDRQAQLVAEWVRSQTERPERAAAYRRRIVAGVGQPARGTAYLKSPRHLLEVEHFAYRRLLERELLWHRK